MPLNLLAEMARKTNEACTITVLLAVDEELPTCMIRMLHKIYSDGWEYIVILVGLRGGQSLYVLPMERRVKFYLDEQQDNIIKNKITRRKLQSPCAKFDHLHRRKSRVLQAASKPSLSHGRDLDPCQLGQLPSRILLGRLVLDETCLFGRPRLPMMKIEEGGSSILRG